MGACNNKEKSLKKSRLAMRDVPECFFFSRSKGKLYQVRNKLVKKSIFKEKFFYSLDSAIGVLSGRRIVILGGTLKTGALSTSATVIHLPNNHIESLPSMPSATKEGQIHEFGNVFYYVGALRLEETGISACPVLKYYEQERVWEEIKESEQVNKGSKLSKISNYGSCVLGGRIFCFGGQKLNKLGTLKTNKTVFSLDFSDGVSVKEEATMPIKLIRPIVAAGDTHALIVGGRVPRTDKPSKICLYAHLKENVLSMHSIDSAGITFEENYPPIYTRDYALFVSYPNVAIRYRDKTNWTVFRIKAKIEQQDLYRKSGLPSANLKIKEDKAQKKSNKEKGKKDLKEPEGSGSPKQYVNANIIITKVPEESLNSSRIDMKIETTQIPLNPDNSKLIMTESTILNKNWHEDDAHTIGKARKSRLKMPKLVQCYSADEISKIQADFPNEPSIPQAPKPTSNSSIIKSSLSQPLLSLPPIKSKFKRRKITSKPLKHIKNNQVAQKVLIVYDSDRKGSVQVIKKKIESSSSSSSVSIEISPLETSNSRKNSKKAEEGMEKIEDIAGFLQIKNKSPSSSRRSSNEKNQNLSENSDKNHCNSPSINIIEELKHTEFKSESSPREHGKPEVKNQGSCLNEPSVSINILNNPDQKSDKSGSSYKKNIEDKQSSARKKNKKPSKKSQNSSSRNSSYKKSPSESSSDFRAPIKSINLQDLVPTIMSNSNPHDKTSKFRTVSKSSAYEALKVTPLSLKAQSMSSDSSLSSSSISFASSSSSSSSESSEFLRPIRSKKLKSVISVDSSDVSDNENDADITFSQAQCKEFYTLIAHSLGLNPFFIPPQKFNISALSSSLSINIPKKIYTIDDHFFSVLNKIHEICNKRSLKPKEKWSIVMISRLLPENNEISSDQLAYALSRAFKYILLRKS